MTLTLDLSPELEDELRSLAAREGLAPDTYVVRLLQDRVQRRQSPRLPPAESTLLQEISEGLPAETWRRYHELKARRDADTLTPEEHSELISLSDTIEEGNARRVGLVVDLSRLRNVPFADLMRQLGLEAPHMPERRVPARQKQIVAERAGGRCEYCRSPAAYTPDPFAIEHIHPRARGGTNRLSNLALSCQGYNNRKHTSTSALDPTSGQHVALYHPRADHWHDHFAWSEDGLLMVGLTPIGRATVASLELNRSGVVNLRFALLAIGMHPPESEA